MSSTPASSGIWKIPIGRTSIRQPEDLLGYAHEHGFDLVVAGHHRSRRGGRVLFHDLAERLVAAGTIAVLVIGEGKVSSDTAWLERASIILQEPRVESSTTFGPEPAKEGETMPFNRILVAIDGSPGGQKALETAIELVKITGASLDALAVEGKLPAYAATVGEVDEVKKEKDVFFERLARLARDQAAEEGVELHVELRPGHAAELITRYAKDHGFDLVVVGHKGHFLGDYLLGSTADRVAHHAHCPVLIVK